MHFKTYCYKSIIDSLESLLKRPEMEEDCEKWRTRTIRGELYADVYDGKIWKQFGNWKGNKPLLNLPRSFGLMMNVDWFQPFKQRNDFSVGVIYMVLMNLPRSSRFKKENVILVGVIPALAHEPKSLNHFLEPAVNELNALWKGVKVNTYQSPSTAVEIKAAVLCFASDFADSLDTVQREAALIATRSFWEALESQGTTVALRTEITGQKDPLNSTEEMQTGLRTVNLRMLLIS